MSNPSGGIVLSRLTKSYGEVHAVRSVDLTIAPGETVGLVGESGSGKSSIGRAILGLAPVTKGSIHLDHRLSCYQPMAYVAPHTHKVQEQVYHVLEGEGTMEIAGKRRVVRRHDVIFIPPGVEHAIYNSGLTDLVFIVVTSPASDEDPAE